MLATLVCLGHVLAKFQIFPNKAAYRYKRFHRMPGAIGPCHLMLATEQGVCAGTGTKYCQQPPHVYRMDQTHLARYNTTLLLSLTKYHSSDKCVIYGPSQMKIAYICHTLPVLYQSSAGSTAAVLHTCVLYSPARACQVSLLTEWVVRHFSSLEYC